VQMSRLVARHWRLSGLSLAAAQRPGSTAWRLIGSGDSGLALSPTAGLTRAPAAGLNGGGAKKTQH
jgi:hypothetical protein